MVTWYHKKEMTVLQEPDLESQYYDLTDRESNIAVMKKLSELQKT